MRGLDWLDRLANYPGWIGIGWRYAIAYTRQIGTRFKSVLIISAALMAVGYILFLVAGAFSSKPSKEAKGPELDTDEQLQWRLNEIDRLDVSEPVDSLLQRELDTRSAPTLKMLVLFHRHGDRTPNEFDEGNPLASEPFWYHHGLGALTNRGRARMYLLGELTRHRYASFLGDDFNKLQVISRSSGLERCIESGQMFTAGLMRRTFSQLAKSSSRSPRWDTIGTLGAMWEPLAMQTFHAAYDGLLSTSSVCPTAGMEVIKMDKNAKLLAIEADYQEERNKIPQEVKSLPILYQWALIDDRVITESDYFPDKVSPTIKKVRAKVSQATSLAFMTYAKDNATARRLRGGLMANELLGQLEKTAESDAEAPVKFIHLSTQDAQLSFLLGMLNVWDQDQRLRSRPDYGSSMVFELHRDHEWFVKIVYYNSVPGEPVELKPVCYRGERGCRLDEFKKILEPVRMVGGWQQWMEECGNDLSKVNPYKS